MGNGLENVFGNMGEVEAPAPIEEVSAQDQEKSQKNKIMKEAWSALMHEQGTEYNAKLRTLSNSLKVTHTLSFGKDGGLVVDKEATKAYYEGVKARLIKEKASEERMEAELKEAEKKRKLAPVPAIVGYTVQNVGTEPIPYTIEVYEKNEQGIYEARVVNKTMAPNEEVAFTKKALTRFAAIPEISFTFNNAKLKSSNKVHSSLDEELEAHSVNFTDDTKVNDDEVKIPIDTNGDGVVKTEFLATFGYLMNPAPETKKGKRAKVGTGQRYTTQDLNANYVMQLLSK